MEIKTDFTFLKEDESKEVYDNTSIYFSSLKTEKTFYEKLKYFKNIFFPIPRQLPIDLKLYPFEKTHFYTKEYKKIKNILMKNKKENGIHYFNTQKYSLHGSIIKEREKVDFRINFYKLSSKKYIVEFQKRDGCHLTWYKHYQEMKKQIISFI